MKASQYSPMQQTANNCEQNDNTVSELLVNYYEEKKPHSPTPAQIHLRQLQTFFKVCLKKKCKCISSINVFHKFKRLFFLDVNYPLVVCITNLYYVVARLE